MGRSSAPTVARLGGMRQARGPARPVPSLSAGDRVNHDSFGLGSVVRVEGVGPKSMATVDFGGDTGVKRFLLGIAPLEKL